MNISIKPIICSQCGGNIQINYCSSFIVCPYCGTTFSASYSGNNSGSFITGGDNPIDVKMSKIQSKVIQIGGVYSTLENDYKIVQENEIQKMNSTVKSSVEFIRTLSRELNQELEAFIVFPKIGEVGYREISTDKINWGDKKRYDEFAGANKKNADKSFEYVRVLKNLLESNGFTSNEKWVSSKEKVAEIPKQSLFGKQKYSKNYLESCFLEGVIKVNPQSSPQSDGYIERLKGNSAVAEIAKGIKDYLKDKETDFLQSPGNGEKIVEISFKKDAVLIDYFASKNATLNFHSLGMENMENPLLIRSLAVNTIADAGINKSIDWMIKELSVGDSGVTIKLVYRNVVNKTYKSW